MLYVKYSSPVDESKLIYENNPLIATLFNDAPDAIFVLDAKDYSIIDCNTKALIVFEAESKSSLINLPSFRLYESEPIEFSRNLQELNLKNGGEHTQELAFRTLKQNIFWGKLKNRTVKIEEQECIILRISKVVDYQNAEEALSSLLRGTAKVTGTKYFKELSKLLCRAFDVKYSFIGKLAPSGKSFKVLELCGPLLEKETMQYEVSGTMVENVMKGFTTFYPSGVCDYFPNDEIAVTNRVEGFMGTPIFGNSGEVIGVLAIMHDRPIQEIPNSRYILSIFASRTAAEIQRIRSKEILKEQTKSLATANTVKDKLLAVISHDLINPLHSVMGFSELLYNKIDTYNKEKIINKVEIIDNSIKNIYFLLENLSDWSRIFRNSVRPYPEIVDIKNLIDDNLALFRYIIEIKDLKIKVGLTETTHIFVDKHMLGTIIRNVLSNSVKYTAKGGNIEINCEEKKQMLTISMKDSGIGMTEEELSHLLESKEMPDLQVPRKNSTGLGLVLSKNFAERIGGELRITSSLNVGTEVFIDIPKA